MSRAASAKGASPIINPEPEVEVTETVRCGICAECGERITGCVFMLSDRAYCCQRHRLVAYHKLESDVHLKPTNPLSAPAPGLRGAYTSWM